MQRPYNKPTWLARLEDLSKSFCDVQSRIQALEEQIGADPDAQERHAADLLVNTRALDTRRFYLLLTMLSYRRRLEQLNADNHLFLQYDLEATAHLFIPRVTLFQASCHQLSPVNFFERFSIFATDD